MTQTSSPSLAVIDPLCVRILYKDVSKSVFSISKLVLEKKFINFADNRYLNSLKKAKKGVPSSEDITITICRAGTTAFETFPFLYDHQKGNSFNNA